MSERWIRSSKKILERIEKFEKAKDRDRLELVRSTWFMLGALQRSLVGWLQWVKNPEMMVKFSKEELEEINSNIAKFARASMKLKKQHQ